MNCFLPISVLNYHEYIPYLKSYVSSFLITPDLNHPESPGYFVLFVLIDPIKLALKHLHTRCHGEGVKGVGAVIGAEIGGQVLE